MEKLQKKQGKIMMKKHGRFFVNRTRRVAREHMPTPAIITAQEIKTISTSQWLAENAG